jgi:hypothetical protein
MSETNSELTGMDPTARDIAESHVSEAVQLMEDIEWAAVSDVSPAEAAAWTARLVEARDTL